uniref:Uncharacterized protein n=1 Tax=Anopheles dirus TaxID=7168 RepID=A0A182N319_9DIPT
MGLKLKWFRRRITFDGIPSAPERDIRRKEATAGTVIGVYRQSTNFEDYIEPVRTSYWEPPPQAIARATIRSNGKQQMSTSTNSPSNSYTSVASSTPRTARFAPLAPPPVPTEISSVSRPASSMGNVGNGADSRDKIGRPPVERLQLRADYETPPEPNYTPPQPPARKARSMANLANSRDSLEGTQPSKHSGAETHELRSPRSVEVLSDPNPRAVSPPASPIHVVPIASVPKSASSNSLPVSEVVTPTSEPEYIVPLATQESVEEPIYDSFDAIFERVTARKHASPDSQRSNRPDTSSPLPRHREPARNDDAIFERVKISSPGSPDSQRSISTGTPETPSPPPQRKPVLQVTTVPNPQTSPPPQPKSILKKRAPPPPQQTMVVEATSSMVDFTAEMATTIPTPPPRSARAISGVSKESPTAEEPVKMIPQAPNVPDPDSDSDDDDFNWDFVQKHRSSINQTVAAHTQIDPEVLRNAPASLRNGTPAQVVPSPRAPPVEPVAQPRTLRGMRNQRIHTQLQTDSDGSDGRQWNGPPAVQIPPPRARASDSNASETSA